RASPGHRLDEAQTGVLLRLLDIALAARVGAPRRRRWPRPRTASGSPSPRRRVGSPRWPPPPAVSTSTGMR
ncbi:hypothetical protein, partial [Micromonospora sp. ATA51]|uniref:hypothetical protein n=1 Tax=Micromonospora sp. ATA51 TaxID=2806098 RepID=UPI001EE4916E